MRHGTLPDGLRLQRTTDEFDATTVPKGLLRAHRVAHDVWGLLEVRAGTLRFVWEDPGADPPIDLAAGDSVVIPPDVPHRVEPGPDARFAVQFHR